MRHLGLGRLCNEQRNLDDSRIPCSLFSLEAPSFHPSNGEDLAIAFGDKTSLPRGLGRSLIPDPITSSREAPSRGSFVAMLHLSPDTRHLGH
jgi:hypothetical protein